MRFVTTVRNGLWLLLALGLGGCAVGGPTVFERIGRVAEEVVLGAEKGAPTREPTRAELNRIPYATIAISSEGRARAFLVPLSNNRGYLNYRDAEGNAVVLFGGALSGTESLGNDLQAVRHHPRDPIAHQTPLARWPGRVQREYQYQRRDLDGYSIVLDCVFDRIARERIVIVEVSFDVVRVAETCTNAQRQITNTYWVDEATGFIWRSEQWIGPRLGHATIEIIRAYGV